MRKITGLLLYVFLASGMVLSIDCSHNRTKIESPPPPAVETNPAAGSASPDLPADAPIVLPAPNREAVREAITRVYRDVLILDDQSAGSARPGDYFTVGDFNGDGSQDLAVAVKPAARKIEELNSQFANWLIQDVTRNRLPVTLPGSPGLAVAVPDAAAEKVSPEDKLLAVIHGYRRFGWRDPAARQTYLLKKAGGRTVEILPRAEAIKVVVGKRMAPFFPGDVIRKRNSGKAGLLYWTGEGYSLYPLGS